MKSALIALLAVCTTLAGAEESERFEWFPLQLSMVPKMQMMVKEVTIFGLKLNLFNGENDRVRGLDLGVFGGSGDFVGVQVNVANYVQWKTVGLRIGAINDAKDATGLAVGVVNLTDGLTEGVEIGAVNIGGDVLGLQVGVVNYCHRWWGCSSVCLTSSKRNPCVACRS